MNIYIFERSRKIITTFCQVEYKGGINKPKHLHLVKGKVKVTMVVS